VELLAITGHFDGNVRPENIVGRSYYPHRYKYLGLCWFRVYLTNLALNSLVKRDASIKEDLCDYFS
jgi:hypothetical protein